jgi:putative addiction module component (TIGR02574 family)
MTTRKTTYFAQVAERSDSVIAGAGATVGHMTRLRFSDFLKLPVSERLKFVDASWESGAQTPGMLQLTDEERAELKQRMRDFAKNPDDGSPWPEVKERILKRG